MKNRTATVGKKDNRIRIALCDYAPYIEMQFPEWGGRFVTYKCLTKNEASKLGEALIRFSSYA